MKCDSARSSSCDSLFKLLTISVKYSKRTNERKKYKLLFIKSSTTYNTIVIFEHPLEPVNKKDNRIEITVSVINRHATQLNGRTS